MKRTSTLSVGIPKSADQKSSFQTKIHLFPQRPTENPKTTNQHRLILQGEGFCDDGECLGGQDDSKKAPFFLLESSERFEA